MPALTIVKKSPIVSAKGEEMAFRYQFNEQKATQAAAFLIAANGGQINYMKLIKLLYLANRKAFQT
jgi:hypothetical protein